MSRTIGVLSEGLSLEPSLATQMVRSPKPQELDDADQDEPQVPESTQSVHISLKRELIGNDLATPGIHGSFTTRQQLHVLDIWEDSFEDFSTLQLRQLLANLVHVKSPLRYLWTRKRVGS
eukprot:TRINITY_DN399_c0_g1_i4.p1 TRINITY_DN399_c0_g1~~TRINITY_DN399_c0_g1_i4.p1  ORF type:complete len:120 (-),score=9.21 TRINITY_DN399_c0_g1_i4:49-408(-)